LRKYGTGEGQVQSDALAAIPCTNFNSGGTRRDRVAHLWKREAVLNAAQGPASSPL